MIDLSKRKKGYIRRRNSPDNLYLGVAVNGKELNNRAAVLAEAL